MAGNLSPTDIAQLGSNAGFSGNDLVTATAIGIAESGGNPSAYNPETQAGAQPGQGSYGIFQIFSTAHPNYSTSDLLDPQQNANAAYDVYSSAGGFSPWSTYNNGSYQNYLGQAQDAVNSLLGGSSSSWEESSVGDGDGTQILISPWVIGVGLGIGVILVWGLAD